MILLSELLEDKVYSRFFNKPPTLPDVLRIAPPYRLWVQPEPQSPWKKRDTTSYASALKWIENHLDDIYNGAIAIKGIQTPPPKKLVRVKRNGVLQIHEKTGRPVTKEVPWRFSTPSDERKHRWCPYCRRPTIFTWFSKHHNMPHVIQPEYSRCTICGFREDSLRRDY